MTIAIRGSGNFRVVRLIYQFNLGIRTRFALHVYHCDRYSGFALVDTFRITACKPTGQFCVRIVPSFRR
jgi:hypothetical protein